MKTQQEFFDALFDPALPTPAGLAIWNGSDPAVRFAVHRNNVVASLIDALADTYPVTQELVGEEFFRAMAHIFIGVEPPRSRVLAFYGVSLPAFIEHFPAAATVPYLADVARLEMLRVCAYHAAECAPLPANAIAQAIADVDMLPVLLTRFHPSVAILRSRYAVVSLWSAHQGVADISTVDPYVPECALVVRPHLDVEVVRLTPADCAFVALLLGGASLGTAVEQARETDTAFDPIGIVSLLVKKQAISSITTRRDQP